MRLIDADALLAEYDRQHEGQPEKARKLIEDAPTIDRPTRSQFKRMAVQLGYEKVVYCKYCKHRDPESKRCDCGCWHIPFITRDNDFCPYGDMLTNTNRESVEPATSYSLVEKSAHSII